MLQILCQPRIIVSPPLSIILFLPRINEKAINAVRVAIAAKASTSLNAKEEKRPWILRARELSVQAGKKLTPEENNILQHRLVYISCGWESFKEDCKSLLSSRAWELEKAHGFNFFPGTDSIEVLAVFNRRIVMKKKKKPGIKKVRAK